MSVRNIRKVTEYIPVISYSKSNSKTCSNKLKIWNNSFIAGLCDGWPTASCGAVR